MLALERLSPDQVLVFLCSHAGVCLTSALIPHLENPRPSESQLEVAAWSPAVERNAACPSSCDTQSGQQRTTQGCLLLTLGD